MPQNAITNTVQQRLHAGGQVFFSFRCITDHDEKAPH